MLILLQRRLEAGTGHTPERRAPRPPGKSRTSSSSNSRRCTRTTGLPGKLKLWDMRRVRYRDILSRHRGRCKLKLKLKRRLKVMSKPSPKLNSFKLLSLSVRWPIRSLLGHITREAGQGARPARSRVRDKDMDKGRVRYRVLHRRCLCI
jgi:hypothetical protein